MAKRKKEKKATPLMVQYNNIKATHPDAILLFRVGDFYETFGKDAITAASVLGITLTKRGNGSANEVELAGFPHHALDTYLPKLVKAGYRAAICEQLEDPKSTKKLVKRGVTELVTPGVALNDKILDHKSNNYLCSICYRSEQMGLSFLDASTGEFLVAEGNVSQIDKLLQSFSPAELIFCKTDKKQISEHFGERYYTYGLEDWVFSEDFARETLLKHFGTKNLKGFGVQGMTVGVVAAGAALHYIQETAKAGMQHISSLRRLHQDKYVWLDNFTIRNLELLHSPNENGVPLLRILDSTKTAMGSRLLKKWIALPLRERTAVEERLDVVGFLKDKEELAGELRRTIAQIGDIERLIARVPVGKINPREVVQLKKALIAIGPIKELCLSSGLKPLTVIGDQLNPCVVIKDRISRELNEEVPVQVSKGSVIAAGVSEELDELRAILHSGKDYLEKLKLREIENTGISSLKIGFNNVFGYYLEVTNKYKGKAPEDWIRKQTLVNAERYITEELKEYEQKIFGAEDKILLLEARLFDELVQAVGEYIKPIQHNAHTIARLDCLLSFAEVSARNDYQRPNMTDGLELDIKQGRHPVIERQLALGESYVPNDLYLDDASQQLIIITGPNMSGKSALLRQTALIALMAQMGCFVPAQEAQIGMVDKIFTRVGASDNLSMGESTFMVEMNETASIMNNLSKRSLVLLDEIGRGTSTYDGISIAWALAEFIHEHKTAKAKTLFATHYHELTELSGKFDRIKNYSVSTKEVGKKVIFLRKLIPEGSKHSFGIHVARMAGMPTELVQRATEILAVLEKKNIEGAIGQDLQTMPVRSNMQLSIFEMDPLLKQLQEQLMSLDLNSMTPIEALLKLQELKKLC